MQFFFQWDRGESSCGDSKTAWPLLVNVSGQPNMMGSANEISQFPFYHFCFAPIWRFQNICSFCWDEHWRVQGGALGAEARLFEPML